jgi:hypothetical protein
MSTSSLLPCRTGYKGFPRELDQIWCSGATLGGVGSQAACVFSDIRRAAPVMSPLTLEQFQVRRRAQELPWLSHRGKRIGQVLPSRGFVVLEYGQLE